VQRRRPRRDISLTDRFFGDVDPAVRRNADLADRLDDRLLLIHGQLDDNVMPSRPCGCTTHCSPPTWTSTSSSSRVPTTC
jgi:hypothetical protein